MHRCDADLLQQKRVLVSDIVKILISSGTRMSSIAHAKQNIA